MITRIVMNKTIEAAGKAFLSGEVYDSRFTADTPVAEDGIQHFMPQNLIDTFVADGSAHEETTDEYWKRIDERRKAMLVDPTGDEESKQLIRQQDAFAAAVTPVIEAVAVFRPQPTRGTAPTNPATLIAKGDL